MKSTIFFAIALLVPELAHAQPHRAGRSNLRHAHLHIRDVVTETVVVTVTAAEVVVYVDENGNPLSTSYGEQPEAPPAPVTTREVSSAQLEIRTTSETLVEEPSLAIPPSAVEPSAPPAAVPSEAPVEDPVETPAVPPAVSAVPSGPPPASSVITSRASEESPADPTAEFPNPSAPSPIPSVVSSDAPPEPSAEPSNALPTRSETSETPTQGSDTLPAESSAPDFPIGITYSPYLPGRCKTQEEVTADFEKLTDYNLVRFYGVDCEQNKFAVKAAEATNKKLIIGIYDIKQIDEGIKIIKDEAGDFSRITLITIGNEEVHKGTDAASVVTALKDAKTKLAAIGWKGPVTSVDTFGDVERHPELCGDSDLVTVNAQAFFTKEVSSDQAGQYVADRVNDVKNICGQEKRAIVVEAGWPNAGDTNGNAVPSPEDQQTAIQSLKDHFKDGGIMLFTAFDDTWKTDFAGSFNAEKHWGILGGS